MLSDKQGARTELIVGLPRARSVSIVVVDAPRCDGLKKRHRVVDVNSERMDTARTVGFCTTRFVFVCDHR